MSVTVPIRVDLDIDINQLTPEYARKLLVVLMNSQGVLHLPPDFRHLFPKHSTFGGGSSPGVPVDLGDGNNIPLEGEQVTTKPKGNRKRNKANKANTDKDDVPTPASKGRSNARGKQTKKEAVIPPPIKTDIGCNVQFEIATPTPRSVQEQEGDIAGSMQSHTLLATSHVPNGNRGHIRRQVNTIRYAWRTT